MADNLYFHINATELNLIDGLTDEQMRYHRDALLADLKVVNRMEGRAMKAQARVRELTSELERRQSSQDVATRHQESSDLTRQTLGVGRETLSWTKIGAKAAIVAAVAAILALLLNIPLSKLLRATSSQALRPSSKRMLPIASPSQSPTAERPASQTPPASPTER